MYWGDVFTSPLFFINFPAYKNYTLTVALQKITINLKHSLYSKIIFQGVQNKKLLTID